MLALGAVPLAGQDTVPPPDTTSAVDSAAAEPGPPGDVDGDGVPDVVDACPRSPAGSAVSSTGCAEAAGMPGWLILGGLVLVLGLGGVAAHRLWIARHADESWASDWPALPVLFGTEGRQAPPRVSPAPVRRPPPGNPSSPSASAPVGAAAPASRTAPRGTRADEDDDADTFEAGETVDVGTVQFHRPPEGTLALLPGRLEIVEGDATRDGIRFVKVPGTDAEVTFGRSGGPPHRHIQLKVSTVSRMHARMRFDAGTWRIENLSQTNPVTVNLEPLNGRGAPRPLEDGDRIEMGEVVFRYRDR